MARKDITAWAKAAGLPRPLLDDLLLVIGEATANSVEHAYRDRPAGDFSYELRCTTDGGVSGVVTDGGHWRPVPTDNGTRGRGLAMIKAASVLSEVHGSETGTRVDPTHGRPPARLVQYMSRHLRHAPPKPLTPRRRTTCAAASA